ncbi:uncharacterized protein TM35_000073290 [Trypanosoma theileri]|uniref:Uncharacterized protein n=1 Tax=Trypanosoma theileri TaxID=67003 RepID=A0A1X0P1Y2_9TRYP|nr:uncharacterized protein TM35_000073290 [Trypanosoma theileri]ORC90905.1 hypothetical protein TM35_000073290 [Trypanosoma theileri]
MKGLEEWLASTTESEEEEEGEATTTTTTAIGRTRGQGTVVSTREDIRARQEEMRDRMQQLLGSKITEGENNDNKNQNSKNKSKSISSVSSSSSRTKQSKNSAGNSSKEKKKDDGINTSTVEEENNKREYRCVEVMVVDRGTQTTTTVGCQTDPILPYQPLPGATLPIPTIYSSSSSNPPCCCCRCCCCSCGGMGNKNAGVRRPYAKALEAKELPTRFKEQIEMIQNSIDIMIARYNLPPPPPFSSV